MELYLIEWIDACHYDDERNTDSEDFHCVIIKTVGFLVSQNENEYVIAMDNITSNERVRNVTVIPRLCVKQIIKLAEAIT